MSTLARSTVALVFALAGGCVLTTDLDGLSGGDIPADAGGDAGDLATELPDTGPPPAEKDAGSDAGILGCGSADAGLVGYWPMEENAGVRVGDCSGNDLGATAFGDVQWVAGRSPQSSALAFDGNDATYVEVVASPRLELVSSFTLVAWVNLEPGFDSNMVTKGSWVFDLSDLSFAATMDSEGEVTFSLCDTENAITQTSAPGVPFSTWFHLAMVYEAGKSQTVYVDGTAKQAEPAPASLGTSAPPLTFGLRTKGKIDEVRLYSRVLTDDEIRALAAE